MALTKRKIPRPPKSAATTRPPKAPAARAATAVPAKNFKITAGERPTDGKKILVHADSGMGKTTLASLAPGPVFIGLDNGGVGIKVYHRVGDDDTPVETYLDVRAALQAGIYDEYESVVLDTVTILEEWAEQHVLDTITNDSGEKMNSIVK